MFTFCKIKAVVFVDSRNLSPLLLSRDDEGDY